MDALVAEDGGVSSPRAGVHPAMSPISGCSHGVFPARGGSPISVALTASCARCLPRVRGSPNNILAGNPPAECLPRARGFTVLIDVLVSCGSVSSPRAGVHRPYPTVEE